VKAAKLGVSLDTRESRRSESRNLRTALPKNFKGLRGPSGSAAAVDRASIWPVFPVMQTFMGHPEKIHNGEKIS
jgi:hypothetical protein